MAFEEERHIALEIIKMWFNEHDAVYLAKEDVVVHWLSFNPDSKRGEWNKLSLRETVRIIRATRSKFTAMKFINPELVLLGAQELGRTYKQGVTSRSVVPEEYFNFNRVGYFTESETLTLCILQTLVGRGMNVETKAFGTLFDHVFKAVNFKVPSRTQRWTLLRAVAEEGGMEIRDRTNRLSVTGVGRFVCLHIVGIDDSIKLSFSDEELEDLTKESVYRYKTR